MGYIELLAHRLNWLELCVSFFPFIASQPKPPLSIPYREEEPRHEVKTEKMTD